MTLLLRSSDIVAILAVIDEYLHTPECCVGLDDEAIERIESIEAYLNNHVKQEGQKDGNTQRNLRRKRSLAKRVSGLFERVREGKIGAAYSSK